MSSTISFRKGAIAQCADNNSPNVRSSQWACLTKTNGNNKVEELYIFDDKEGAEEEPTHPTLERKLIALN